MRDKGNKGMERICDMMNVMPCVRMWVHWYWMRNGCVCVHDICDGHKTKGRNDITQMGNMKAYDMNGNVCEVWKMLKCVMIWMNVMLRVCIWKNDECIENGGDMM